jgi:transposase-like protein/IS1 family transposase
MAQADQKGKVIVVCHRCQLQAFKFGKQNGFQRFRCRMCGKTFSDIPERPLGELRVEPAKAHQVISLLVEGVGIRAVERLTQLNRRTVLGILATAGEKCARLLDTKVTGIIADHIELDELYAFVGCKQENTEADDTRRGDFYTFLSIDPRSKLIVNWQTDKRTREAAVSFLSNLKHRVSNRFQLSTDGWQIYSSPAGAVKEVFGQSVDYATEIKYFGTPTPNQIRRGRKELIGIRKHRSIGRPNLDTTTTAHVERTNLSVRLFNRRFTRLTLGYSKKLENLRFSVALFVAHFNFCRVHSAHKQTPAMTANLTDHPWTVSELMETTL